MSKKEVLVVYGQRRRPVTYSTSSVASTEHTNLTQAVRVAFADVVEVNEGNSSSTSSEWYLQTESAMWGMVDVTVTNTQQLVNRSTIHIVRSTVKEADGRPSGEKVCSFFL